MTKRVLLAGVLGGIAMFAWSSIAHMALPLGEVGIKEIPNEQPVLSAMQAQIGGAPGLYLFPGMGLPPDATHAQKSAAMQQYEQKLAGNPSGLLLYHPPGAKGMSMGLLLTEFITELVEALLVVFLLAQTSLTSFAGRVGFVTVAGILAAITTNIPYWNWYKFPTNYTIAYMVIEIVGFLCVGIVAAFTMKGGAAKSVAAAV
jgi:hypothetical protein